MLKAKDVSVILNDADRKQLIEIISKMTGLSDEAETWLIKEYGDSSNPVIRSRRVELWLLDMWKQIKPLIKESNYVGIEDYEEGEYVREILTYLSEPEDIEFASWKVRKKLLNEMEHEYMRGDGEFDDMLFDVMKNLCTTEKELEYLKSKVRGIWRE